MEWTREQREVAARQIVQRVHPGFTGPPETHPVWGLMFAKHTCMTSVAVDLQCELNLLRAASPPEAAGRWIDCNQELPPENQIILLWKPKISSWENRHVFIGENSYAGLRQEGANGDWHKEYSHWQPLPAPPSGEQSSISENGRSSDFNNEEKLQCGEQSQPDAVNETETVAPGPQEGREP